MKKSRKSIKIMPFPDWARSVEKIHGVTLREAADCLGVKYAEIAAWKSIGTVPEAAINFLETLNNDIADAYKYAP
jgi:hypothetical protein